MPRREWPLSPRMNRAERLVIGAFLLVLLLVGWGGWMLWQSMERHRATADETARDHASYMAASYRGSYQTETWFAVRTLLAAAQEAAESPGRFTDQKLINDAMARALGPGVPPITPLRFFRQHDGNWEPTSLDGTVDSVLRASLQQGIGDSLTGGASYAVALVNRDDELSLAFAEPRRDGNGWVGFEVAGADVARHILAGPPEGTLQFLNDRLDSLGVSELRDQLISTQVIVGDSLVLFNSGGTITDGWSGTVMLWNSLPGRVVVTVGRGALPYLMPGGFPPAPGPRVAAVIGLGILLTAATALLVWRMLTLARMRDAFTASVSHELRTPLANIHLYAETLLLERATDPVARRSALETITRETRRLGDMVENILAAARMSRAEEQIEPREDDIPRLVAEVIDAFTPLLQSRGMRVDVERLGSDTAMIDGSAVRRILVNLLDNAIRHGPDGQHLRVVVDHRDNTLLLVVEDQGPGIPDSERERIWQPYARGKDGGSGLGLAVVRHLARLHGGDAVVGEHDGGARIEVRLAAGVA